MKNNSINVFLIFLAFCSSVSLGVADAATLEVGTGKTYSAIQPAINDASPDDTVLVYDGTYVENITFIGKAITIKSVNGAVNTIINGNSNGAVVLFNNNEGEGSVLEGFTLTNGSGHWRV